MSPFVVLDLVTFVAAMITPLCVFFAVRHLARVIRDEVQNTVPLQQVEAYSVGYAMGSARTGQNLSRAGRPAQMTRRRLRSVPREGSGGGGHE